MKYILRYLHGSVNSGLHLQCSNDLTLQAFCGADWAGCPDDRRSITGFAIFLGPNVISWSSKKQTTISKSSTKVEYRAMAVTTTKIVWIQTLLKELGCASYIVPSIWCDNLSATFLTGNPVFHTRTNHIELDYHFVREKLAAKQLSVHFICSDDHIANIFTKSLAKSCFQALMTKLTICSIMLGLRGVQKSKNLMNPVMKTMENKLGVS
jgi:hypothetical protein